MRFLLLIAASFGLGSDPGPKPSKAPRIASDTAVARQVDHLVLGFPDPTAAFHLLRDTLELPMAWPLGPIGPYLTGGVSAGNMNIELGRVASRPGVPLPRVSAVVFEPAPLEGAMAALDGRNVAHGPSVPFGLQPGAPSELPGWRTVMLSSLTDERLNVVLCEYVRPDMPAFRRTMADSLRAHGGGPLGVQDASLVRIGTGGDSAFTATMQRAFGISATSMWRGVGGPAVTLDTRAPRGAVELTLRVHSLGAAERALRDRHVSYVREGATLRLTSASLGGIPVLLSE